MIQAKCDLTWAHKNSVDFPALFLKKTTFSKQHYVKTAQNKYRPNWTTDVEKIKSLNYQG